MILDLDLVSQAFYVDTEPDLWKAKTWAAGTASARVIETVVGAYGALDQKFGVTYFDVGDWLLKLPELRQVVVINKDTMERLEKLEEDLEDDERD